MTRIEWRDMHAGEGYFREYAISRDKRWSVRPTPKDQFAPIGAFRDAEWLGGAVSIDAGKKLAELMFAEDPQTYQPGETVRVLNYDGVMFSFVLTDTFWYDGAGVFIDHVTTQYYEGHGTEYTVHVRQDSVDQWRESGRDLELDDGNTIVLTDSFSIGDTTKETI